MAKNRVQKKLFSRKLAELKTFLYAYFTVHKGEIVSSMEVQNCVHSRLTYSLLECKIQCATVAVDAASNAQWDIYNQGTKMRRNDPLCSAFLMIFQFLHFYLKSYNF